jgi:CBS domain-containing protein
MPVLEEQRCITAHADLVWSVVADLEGRGGLPPATRRIEVLGGHGQGMRRRLTGRDGYVWTEECVAWQDGSRYTLQVIDGDFPISLARLRYSCVISAEGSTVRLRLYFDYQPRFGVIGRIVDSFGNRRRLAAFARGILDNWVRIIHVREWAHRVTVATLLNEKGRDVFTVEPGCTVADAAAELRERRIGSVMVLDADGSISGVVSERDIVRGLAEQGAQLLGQPVRNIMTRDVIVATLTDNMMSVMACMNNRRIRHLPVVEKGKPVGVISIGDVVNARISELEGQSETLRDFIEARRWHELYREIGPAAYAGDAAETTG